MNMLSTRHVIYYDMLLIFIQTSFSNINIYWNKPLEFLIASHSIRSLNTDSNQMQYWDFTEANEKGVLVVAKDILLVQQCKQFSSQMNSYEAILQLNNNL